MEKHQLKEFIHRLRGDVYIAISRLDDVYKGELAASPGLMDAAEILRECSDRIYAIKKEGLHE